MAEKSIGLAVAVGQIPALVLGITLSIIFIGLSVYILTQMSSTAEIPILGNMSNVLGSWANTWFPIILMVLAAGVIITVLIYSFSFGGR